MADRKAKAKKIPPKSNFGGTVSKSVLCPICRTILTEPVTLPCNHVFCKPCFEGSMENASLVCPLCRIRVGSWYRRSKKEGKVVDQLLWSAIQQQYPLEVRNKLQGIDNDIEKNEPIIVVASPGEIRREYEKERSKHLEEQRKVREAEEKASAILIKKLKQEEEVRKKMEEKKLQLDALLAKKLAEELNEPSTSKRSPRKSVKKTTPKSGTLDRFLQSEEKPLLPVNKDSLTFTPHRSLKFNRNIPSTSPILIKSCLRSVKPVKKPQVSSSPRSLKSYFIKEYPCQVISTEESPRVTRENSLFADLDFRDNLGKRRRKGEKSKAAQDSTSERDSCISGYKSSGSGDNSDVIDQECKFYFKPIDLEKRYHLPWKPPLKLRTVRGSNDDHSPIRAPSGSLSYFNKESSAFARFMKDEVDLRSSASSSSEVEMEQTSVNPKRALSPEIRSSATKRLRVSPGESPPFYGFDSYTIFPLDIPKGSKQITRRVDASPFYGFDVLHLSESVQHRDKLSNMVTTLVNTNPRETNNETDINKNICNNTDVSKTVDSSRIVNGVKAAVSSLQNSPKKSAIKKVMKSTLSVFDSDSDENLHNLINSICDQSWENSPKSPKNGLKNSDKPETVTSDTMAVTEVKKLRSDEKCSSTKSSSKKSSKYLENERRKQEKADFEYAKKLQAQFDLIGTTSRTRRGTERQITLDEMLSSACRQ